MSSPFSASLALSDPTATERFGAALAPILAAGDVVLLAGDIGAGKTALARSIIQTRLAAEGRMEDVPSPTFTLVQTYELDDDEIWHSDLYRLSGPDHLAELGLDAAFDSAICLVEWPDRLGQATPPGALTIHLTPDATDEGRIARLSADGGDWHTRLGGLLDMRDRGVALADFVAGAGWGMAQRAPLAGDASARRYERLTAADGTRVVLMDADPTRGEDVVPFLRITRHLRVLGLSAPAILAADEALGALLIEDLGDDLFARRLERSPADAHALYENAVDVLTVLHAAPPATGLADYGAVMPALAGLAYQWYLPALAAPDDAAQAGAEATVRTLVATHLGGPKVMILRDYHAENLIWLPDRTGPARTGLLDYQDAMLGHRAYDLISLTTDARRDVDGALAAEMIARYVAETGCDSVAFHAAAAVCAAQRNLRILGVFARLCIRDGKPHYVDYIPRVWAHLLAALDHLALGDLRARVLADLPEPTAPRLEVLKSKCAQTLTP